MNTNDLTGYVNGLYQTADAYALAADAVGLRRDAARYLRSEADRLFREVRAYAEAHDYLYDNLPPDAAWRTA